MEPIPEHCIPCRAMKPADLIDKQTALDRCGQGLLGWDVVEQCPGVLALQHSFKFDDFRHAMQFANEVGDMAEREHHHPTIVVSWCQVQVIWYSFTVKGIHMNDFVCANHTQQIYERFVAA